MQIHPHIASALAADRMAHFRESASAARRASSAREGQRRVELSPGNGSIRLDAYPRLCGLPVTVERHSMDLELLLGGDTGTANADVINNHEEDGDVRTFDHRLPHGPRARHWAL
jgi:hypothetical protein